MELHLNTEKTTAGLVVLPRWDDLRVPITSTKLGGTKDPDFAVYKTNGAGSQGVFTYFFDKNTEEEVFFPVQLPHEYKLGTAIHPHIHWFPKVAGASGAVVNWGLEYFWKDIGQVCGNTTIISGNSHMPNDNILMADKHYITEFGDIASPSDAGKDVSSMLLCRVFRDASSVLKTDDYDDDAGVLEVDFHYQIDSAGSRLEYSK
jgi:hypothetical protein